MIPAAFDYVAPRSLEEALRLLADSGENAKLLAGGHSLVPLLKLRLARAGLLIDLTRIPGLNAIRQEKDRIAIGALATHFEIESSDLLKKQCPLLPQTAREIADVQVRNLGTIGGSLAHADPSADWPAATLALGAEMVLQRSDGDRRLTADEFFRGAMATAVEPYEILTAIRVPVFQRRYGSAYLKVSQQASGFAIVGVAVSLTLDAKGRCEAIGIGITGLGEKAFRAAAVEECLHGSKLTAKLIEASASRAGDGIEPLDDLHASAEFRADLARVYTVRAIQQAVKQATARR